MCGIFGVFSPKADLNLSEPQPLIRLTNLLSHRGPDGGAYWQTERYFFGHRRLSIIDVSGGTQPMVDLKKKVAITFNGEIYNYLELKAELESLGHSFCTRSDTEVILNGWRQWGSELPHKLEGMFAFAIADLADQSLFVARDRFGEKPLFYTSVGEHFYFSSELKALSPLDFPKRRWDERAMVEFLTLNYCSGESSLFSGIKRLAPGTWKWLKADGGATHGTFWSLPAQDPKFNLDYIEFAEELEVRLRKACRFSLRSDVPVGVFLSGGIDSSVVTGLASQEGKISQAYCLDFEDSRFSEFEKAKSVASHFGIPIERVVLDSSAMQSFAEIAEHADDPLADSSCLPVWVLSRYAGSQGKVVLGGDGGDELFGGYLTYRASRLHQGLITKLPSSARSWLSQLSSYVPTGSGKVTFGYKMRRFLRAANLETSEAHRTWNGTWLQTDLRDGCSDLEVRKRLQSDQRTQVIGGDGEALLRSLQKQDLREYLPNDILCKMDRMSMAHGLEVRSPLLNSAVAEWIFRAPEEFIGIGSNYSKRPLRNWVGKHLGQSVANAKKQGFSIPIHDWLRQGPGKAILHEGLSNLTVEACEILHPKWVQEKVELHLEGKADLGFELWGLLILHRWIRKNTLSKPSVSSVSGELQRVRPIG